MDGGIALQSRMMAVFIYNGDRPRCGRNLTLFLIQYAGLCAPRTACVQDPGCKYAALLSNVVSTQSHKREFNPTPVRAQQPVHRGLRSTKPQPCTLTLPVPYSPPGRISYRTAPAAVPR